MTAGTSPASPGAGPGAPGAAGRRRLPGRYPIGSPYLLCSVFVLLGAVVLSFRQPWGADFGLHVAAVGRLRDDLLHPGNPMVEAPGPSPYFTPYSIVLGAVAALTGASAATVASAAGPVNLAVFLYGLRRFVGLFSTSRWAPVLALVFVPLLWGPTAPRWSGFPALRGLVLILPYPSTLALGLMLLGWVALARALASKAPGWWLASGLLGGVLALIHPFTALAAAVGAGALAAGPLRRGARALWRLALAGIGLAAVVVFSWPYFRVTGAVTSVADLDAIHRRLYDSPVTSYGLAFLVGLPALVLRLRRDRLDPLVLLFAGGGLLVLVGLVGGGYSLGRVWVVPMLSLQVAAAVELTRTVAVGLVRSDAAATVGRARTGPRRRVATVGWAAVALVASLVGFAGQYGNLLLVLPAERLTPAFRAAHGVVAAADYSWVAREVPAGAVLLTGSVGASRALLEYEIRAVAPPWPDPFLGDEGRRRADQTELLAPATSAARRSELLARYDVAWVLDPDGSYSWADPYAVRTVTGPGGHRLLRMSYW